MSTLSNVLQLPGALRDLAKKTAPETAAHINALAEDVDNLVKALGPEALETLEGAQEIERQVAGIVEEMRQAKVAEHVVDAVETVLPKALEVLDLVRRLTLRGSNTLKGLFPLTCELKATPGSALAALLRDAEGKPGSLTVTITPAHIPG